MTYPPVNYLETGEGEPLLLLHGGFADGPGTWTVQIESLRPYHRLLILDRRGHGESPREPRPYTISGDAADALVVADRAGVDRFHVAALSYGGLVALELAAVAPERVLSLHLIEPPYLALLPHDPEVAALDGGIRNIRAEGRERGAEWTATQFFGAILGPDGLREMRSTAAVWRAVVGEALRFADEEYAGDYSATRLSSVRVQWPVRVYTGGRSHPALRKVARRLSELLDGAHLVEISGAGHGVQYVGEAFDKELLAATLDPLR